MSTITAPPPSPGFDEETAALPEMSFEEFLEWLDEDTRAEWVNGKVEFKMPVKTWNSIIAQFLMSILRHWIEAKELGGEILADPVVMKLAPAGQGRRTVKGSGREPHVLYVSRENAGRVEENFVNGPADIAIEIVSPDSRKRDRVTKFFEYEKGGVREYWIIEPELNEAEFYQLDETGRYRRVELESESIYHSTVLSGFTLDVNWLNQRPLPTLMSVLKTWGLV